MQRFRFAFIALIGLSRLSASTVYTTGGTPVTYDTLNAWNIGPFSSFAAVAETFTPTSTAILGEIDVPVDQASGTGNLVVQILANGAGDTPGTVVESITMTVGTTRSLVALQSSLHPTLQSGTKYWVDVTTTGSLTLNWFVASDLNLRSTDMLFSGSWVASSQSTKGAVGILSQTIPEPSTFAMAVLGIALVVSRRLKSA